MAGGYKVTTKDGKDISREVFVLRMQDRCAIDAIEEYRESVNRSLFTLRAWLPRGKAAKAALAAERARLEAHLRTCLRIRNRFSEFMPKKLPD